MREMEKMPAHPSRSLEYVAGRFAAKEAISKALGTGIGGACSFQDIEVTNDGQGKPSARLAGEVIERVFHGQSVRVHLSISHSQHYVQAMAVIESVEEA